MNLEMLIGLDQFKDLYNFHQDQLTATITFLATSQIQVETRLDPDGLTIISGIRNAEPNVYGMMYSRVFRYEESFSKGIYKLVLFKENPDFWPVFIISPSARGIDPRSQFVLGFYQISTFSEESAYQYFKNSADHGFIPAQICVADILLSDTNPYNVPKNIDEAIQILQSIPIEKRVAKVAIRLSDALLEKNNPIEARTTLEESANAYPIVKLKLAKMISPICNKNAKDEDAETAVKYLETLANEYMPEAMKILSMHLAKGKGVTKNLERAISLEKAAHELDPSISIDLNDNSVIKNLSIVGAASILVIGAFLFSNHRRK